MKPTPRSLDNGLLVVFEGIDGSGKTTQLNLAREALQAAGWPALYTTRNLGGTPIGEELRKVIKLPLERPATTNLYISVAIQEALAAEISVRRGQNQFILMDRGPISLAAYEIYGGGLDAELGWQHVDAGLAQLQPELIILYETDVAIARRRIKQKTGQVDYFESQPPSYFKNVAAGYKAAAERYSGQTVIIDGNQPLAAAHTQTMRAITEVLTRYASPASKPS